jgi:hypothetical protein
VWPNVRIYLCAFHVLTPKGQISSELTFESSGRLANEQNGLDGGKTLRRCVGMTPLCGSQIYLEFGQFFYEIWVPEVAGQFGQLPTVQFRQYRWTVRELTGGVLMERISLWAR